MRRALRTVELIAAVALIALGLWRRDGISDGQWLALLAGSWVLLLLAVWPYSSKHTQSTERSIAKIGLVLASVFVLLAVQLARIQVIKQASTIGRRAVDPRTDEVIANPREVNGDLQIDRGRILDRTG